MCQSLWTKNMNTVANKNVRIYNYIQNAGELAFTAKSIVVAFQIVRNYGFHTQIKSRVKNKSLLIDEISYQLMSIT